MATQTDQEIITLKDGHKTQTVVFRRDSSTHGSLVNPVSEHEVCVLGPSEVIDWLMTEMPALV